MKDNLLWGAVVVVIVILAIVLFNTNVQISAIDDTNYKTETGTVNTQTKTGTQSTKTTSTLPIAGMKTSLGGIFDQRGNYQCDYESVTPATRTSNTVYISDGKLRGEFRTIEAGSSKSTIVVYDGDYFYTWTEGQTVGKITQPKTLADLPGIIPADVSSGRILGSGLNSVSWNCHAWSRDASKLIRPSYVTFSY